MKRLKAVARFISMVFAAAFTVCAIIGVIYFASSDASFADKLHVLFVGFTKMFFVFVAASWFVLSGIIAGFWISEGIDEKDN